MDNTDGHGTAFLDEIGELSLLLQTKLLRVLEARHFKRVGGHTALPMAAQVIAATNRSLPELVRTGRFREDLYFRLNVFELWMPPLRERGDDQIVLAQHFLEYFAAHHKKNVTGFASEAIGFINTCDFPGNIRELRNLIERAVINADSQFIYFPELVALNRSSQVNFQRAAQHPAADSSGLSPESDHDINPASNGFHLATIERQKLLEALRSTDGNKSKAAKLVGLSRTAFHRRLQKYGRALPEKKVAACPNQGEVVNNSQCSNNEDEFFVLGPG